MFLSSSFPLILSIFILSLNSINSNIITSIRSKLSSLSSALNNNLISSYPNTNTNTNSNGNSNSNDNNKVKIIPPLLLFFLSTCQSCEASGLNPQLISIKGPFFQGWLARTTDHDNKRSFIFIVGSFSSSSSSKYTEHYIFCGLGLPIDEGGHQQFELFPNPSQVTITGSSPSSASILSIFNNNNNSNRAINITWSASGIGEFHFNEKYCYADIVFPHNLHMKFNSTNRLQWMKNNDNAGPEGWLGYTSLLPCHYYVHSVGSDCSYSLKLLNKNLLIHGKGYTHIEGNHGNFFPDGWVWSQAIAPFNKASLGLVAGKFTIGPISPLNFILYFRKNGRVWNFGSTKLDNFKYDIDSTRGIVKVVAFTPSKNSKIKIKISLTKSAAVAFGKPVHIPTPIGFSNTPGCRESYSATAVVHCYERSNNENSAYFEVETQTFPLTCLEFGGSYTMIGRITSNPNENLEA